MSSDSIDPNTFDHYLGLLGVPKRSPSQAALAELVKAQMTRVPFENVSKLYYRKRNNLRDLPGLGIYLHGIEHHHFGGTCYTNNYYFYLLLEHLGYEARLCGADMQNPDAHLVSMIKVDGREYLVDVGYAAPFLSPLPRDLNHDFTIELGRDRYVLNPPDSNGCSHLDLYRNGRLKHGYTAKPIPRRIHFFKPVIVNSYNDDATFMNALLLVRFFTDRSLAIHNFTLIKSRGTKSHIEPIPGYEALTQRVEDHFSIPRKIVAEAVADLGSLQDAWK